MANPIDPPPTTDRHPSLERIRALAEALGTMIDLGTGFLAWPGGGVDVDVDDGGKLSAAGAILCELPAIEEALNPRLLPWGHPDRGIIFVSRWGPRLGPCVFNALSGLRRLYDPLIERWHLTEFVTLQRGHFTDGMGANRMPALDLTADELDGLVRCQRLLASAVEAAELDDLRQLRGAVARGSGGTVVPGTDRDWIVASQAALGRALGHGSNYTGLMARLKEAKRVEQYDQISPGKFRFKMSDPAEHARIKESLTPKPKPKPKPKA